MLMSQRAIEILHARISVDMCKLNFLAELCNQEFQFDIDIKGNLCLIRCKYSITNSFPEIEVFAELCKGTDPLYKAVIPLEFAMERARKSLYISKKVKG